MSFGKTGFVLTMAGLLVGCTSAPSTISSPRAPAQTPLEATYQVDGQEFVLNAGKVIVEHMPGAASKSILQVYGEPVSGDLNDDGIADAALLLVQDSGGSGTFYHVAAALSREGAFVGLPAVFIGDRITPRQLAIGHGVVIVDYADRRPGEAMAVPPSLAVSKYLVIRKESLEEIELADGELIAAGEVVIGHEVRSFTPCGTTEASWLVGDSPALPAVQIAYYQAMSDASPYTPLFMVLTGRPVPPPVDGFGADYPSGFSISRLVHSKPWRNCAGPVPQLPAADFADKAR